MVQVSIVGPGEGENIVLGPATRMRILEDGSTTEHRLGLAESTLAPHTAGPPQHRHAQHDEGFYVVSGTVRFTIGDQDYDAGPGPLVMVPTGAPHTFANPGDEPAVLLTAFTPDLYVQYFRDMRDVAAAGPRRAAPSAHSWPATPPNRQPSTRPDPRTRGRQPSPWERYGDEPAKRRCCPGPLHQPRGLEPGLAFRADPRRPRGALQEWDVP